MPKSIVSLACKCPKCKAPMTTEYEVMQIVSRQGKKKSYVETIEVRHTRCGHAFVVGHHGITTGLTPKKRLYGEMAEDEILDANSSRNFHGVPEAPSAPGNNGPDTSLPDIDDLIMRDKAHIAYMSRISSGFNRLWPEALVLITHGEYEIACMAMRKCLEYIHKDMALSNIGSNDTSKRQSILCSLDAYKFVDGWDTVDKHIAGRVRNIGNDAAHYGVHNIIGEDALRMMVLIDTLCMRLYIKFTCGASVEDIVERSNTAVGNNSNDVDDVPDIDEISEDDVPDKEIDLFHDVLFQHDEYDVRAAVEDAVRDANIDEGLRELDNLKSNIIKASIGRPRDDDADITVLKIDRSIDTGSISFPGACFDSLTYLRGAVLLACVDACGALDKQGVRYSNDALFLGDVFNDAATRLHMDYIDVFNDCRAAIVDIFPCSDNSDKALASGYCEAANYVVAALRHLCGMHRGLFPPRFDTMLVENDIAWRLCDDASLGDERSKLSAQRLELEIKLGGCTIMSLYRHNDNAY